METQQRCLFCGGDASEPDHRTRCDGRQGGTEDLPLLISGLTAETWATSEAAAIANDESVRETQRDRVFEAIHRAGLHGRTDDEIQVELGLANNSEAPRRIELWKLERITIRRDAEGKPIQRFTRKHRRANVWIDQRWAAGG